MAKINSFVAKLRSDYPAISFVAGDDFYWSPSDRAVYFDEKAPDTSRAIILHELAHALLDHRQYRRDIDLVKIEREAWELARTDLGPQYDTAVADDEIEMMIDTYRDWLHARSTCPACSMTGVQTSDTLYHCVSCGKDWRVNEARRCGLKRYTV